MENICIFPKVDRGWQIYFDKQTKASRYSGTHVLYCTVPGYSTRYTTKNYCTVLYKF